MWNRLVPRVPGYVTALVLGTVAAVLIDGELWKRSWTDRLVWLVTFAR